MPENSLRRCNALDRVFRLGRLAALLGALISAGCATVQPQPGSAGADAAADRGPEFSKDQLYRLLVAEFATKRGQLPLAVENYLHVAHETGDVGIAERAVRLSMYAGDKQSSLRAAEIWTNIAPHDASAKQVYGALLLRSGRVEEAVEQFEAFVSDNPQDQAFDSMSELLSRERDKKVALQAMGSLVAGHETNPHALFAYAKLAFRSGRPELAEEYLERLIGIDPTHEGGATFYARLLQQQGNLLKALSSLSNSLDANPQSKSLRMTYARLLVDAKRYSEARLQFERLVADSPDDENVRYALGLLLLETNHPDEAKPHFEVLTDSPERRLLAYFYLGQIAEASERFDEAIDAYRKVHSGEHYVNAQVRVAVILAEQGALDEARNHLQALPRQSPSQDIRIFRAEAEILRDAGKLTEAMEVYDLALLEHPGDSDLLYARAMLGERMDRLDILERDLRAILRKEPDNADALNALGFTLADRTDRFDEAMQLISRAIELKPDDFYVIDSLGWVLYRLGRYDEAIEQLRRALALSDDTEVAAHLGEVLWVTGDRKGARDVWETALKDTPDDETLIEVMERFID